MGVVDLNMLLFGLLPKNSQYICSSDCQRSTLAQKAIIVSIFGTSLCIL